jgi:hypothetical protein
MGTEIRQLEGTGACSLSATLFKPSILLSYKREVGGVRQDGM